MQNHHALALEVLNNARADHLARMQLAFRMDDVDSANRENTAYRWACKQAAMLKQRVEKLLCDEYDAWLIAQRLPLVSAEELIHENLTIEQRAWVSDFIRRWEASL